MTTNSIYNAPLIRYNDAVLYFKTGDILLTRCDYPKVFSPIEYLSKNVLYSHISSIYTHINIVIIIDDIPYIYTSMGDWPEYDYITKTYKTGNVLMNCRDYIMKYRGNVSVRHLKQHITNTSHLFKYMRDTTDVKFHIGPDTIYRMMFKTNPDHTYTTCIKTTVDAMKILNLFPNNIDSSLTDIADVEKIMDLSNLYEEPKTIINYHTCRRLLNTRESILPI